MLNGSERPSKFAFNYRKVAAPSAHKTASRSKTSKHKKLVSPLKK